jgi:hypothetical protein
VNQLILICLSAVTIASTYRAVLFGRYARNCPIVLHKRHLGAVFGKQAVAISRRIGPSSDSSSLSLSAISSTEQPRYGSGSGEAQRHFSVVPRLRPFWARTSTRACWAFSRGAIQSRGRARYCEIARATLLSMVCFGTTFRAATFTSGETRGELFEVFHNNWITKYGGSPKFAVVDQA